MILMSSRKLDTMDVYYTVEPIVKRIFKKYEGFFNTPSKVAIFCDCDEFAIEEEDSEKLKSYPFYTSRKKIIKMAKEIVCQLSRLGHFVRLSKIEERKIKFEIELKK